jgi:putative ABC transport system permease protein
VNCEAITPGYFQAVGIPIVQGRAALASDEEASPKVVVVSAVMAQRFWPNESPIGKRLKWGRPSSPAPWIEVVGVVGAARYRDPLVESLDVYVPYTQSPWKLNHLGGQRSCAATSARAWPAAIRKRRRRRQTSL